MLQADILPTSASAAAAGLRSLRRRGPRATAVPSMLPLVLLASSARGASSATGGAAWPVCDNRAFRDEEIEPGGLRLLGVKESPLGYFPGVPAAVTDEHFFQQLRGVWSDDCPRIMVQLGLQPAPGRFRNWSAAALWLHYFNHSGLVLAVDAVEDYLGHFEDTLRSSSLAQLVDITSGSASPAGDDGQRMRVTTVRATVAAEGRGSKAKERPVSFDVAGGSKVLAADDVMRSCQQSGAGTDAEDERHPCARILRRIAQPEPLEYLAPLRSFDDIWKRDLQSRHVDFLRVDLGAASMLAMFRKGFKNIVTAREVSVLSFRVDELWTKADLQAVVEWLEEFEYFSMFRLVCSSSSQVEAFSYHGPGGADNGPTTYLPISGVEFNKVIDWERLPLPQDVLAFDLRQPDIFRTVQLGDASCDADETSGEETCANDGSGKCRAAGATSPPGRPERLQVARSESRGLAIEWRAAREGPVPETYALRVDPGSMEDSLEHDGFEMSSGVQMHTITGLKPNTEYTVRLRAIGPGGRSEEAKVVHRTETEQPAASVGSLYDLAEQLHCGMSSSEEVTPAGPPPAGASFFRDAVDPEGCRARCDDNRQCVAFQVKVGDACWLYKRRPGDALLAGPRQDQGWWCGVRKA